MLSAGLSSRCPLNCVFEKDGERNHVWTKALHQVKCSFPWAVESFSRKLGLPQGTVFTEYCSLVSDGQFSVGSPEIGS